MLWVTSWVGDAPTLFQNELTIGLDPLKKKKALTSSEARKKKKDRMARKKRGEEVFSDEEDL